MGTLSVAVKKELNKTKAELQKRRPVANSPLKRLPQTHTFMRQGNYSRSRDAFANSLSVSKVKGHGEIQDQHDHIQQMWQISQRMPFPAVRDIILPKILSQFPHY